MRFRLTEEDAAWQAEVAGWLDSEVPGELKTRPPLDNHGLLGTNNVFDEAHYDILLRFTRKIAERGWLRIGWPEEYGGLKLSPVQLEILQEEMTARNATTIRVMDLPGMIIAHGTKEQKDYWLPPLGRGEIATCLLLSEPEAGSDMANCKCRAVLQGDHFIVNGQKHYVSEAQRADYGQLLVVTDPTAPKRRGLTRLVCDMHAPGVTVRGQRDLAGEVELNEVWFEDVRIRKDWLMGSLNGAWLEMNTDVPLVGVLGRAPDTFDPFVDYCRSTLRGGNPLSQDPILRRKLAALAVERAVITQAEWQRIAAGQRRFLGGSEKSRRSAEGGVQTAVGSMEPLLRKEWRPKFAQAVMEILGPLGQLSEGSEWAPLDGWAERHYRMRAFETHAHGTPEILRMVMATRGLGLPRG